MVRVGEDVRDAQAYVWAYARGAFDPSPGVVYDFCVSRAARHPVAFLDRWSGTLTCDDYAACDVVFKLEDRIEAGSLAHFCCSLGGWRKPLLRCPPSR